MKALPFSLSMLLAALLLGPGSAAGNADLSLSNASATVTLTGDSEWTLSKTGALNPTDSTVTWTITASPVATTPGQLVINGQMTLTNDGNEPATIGNIVVNLQARSGKTWTTRSSVIANATQGDAATTALIHSAASSERRASFTENAASGSLEFADATTNTVISLVPQILIGAGETRTLLFAASFDNNVLGLAAGTTLRAEVIVSFGNATAKGNSTANVDINGNGSIDADEAHVRSVPTRLTLVVPAPVNGNGAVTLTDTIDDITATGDVTFSNVNINLGATSGTVTASVDGGTSGGSITNCAHLTSPSVTANAGGFTFTTNAGLNLEACKSIAIAGSGPPPPCTPGAVGCGWKPGDMLTRTQGNWNDLASWSSTYNSVYAATFGIVEVGIAGTAGFSMRFGSTLAIQNYLVASGTPAALTADLLNPTTSSAGVFGGNMLALQLDVDFSAAGAMGGSANVKFGTLTLCNMTDASLNDMTVSSFLTLASSLLGGNTGTSYTIAAISPLTLELTGAFASGTPSAWAQAHLFNGACP